MLSNSSTFLQIMSKNASIIVKGLVAKVTIYSFDELMPRVRQLLGQRSAQPRSQGFSLLGKALGTRFWSAATEELADFALETVSNPQWAIRGRIKYNQQKMRPAQCRSCRRALNQVRIPKWAKRHIMQRHYQCTGHEEIGQKRSLFYSSMISPRTLFIEIINELRSRLEPDNRQAIHRRSRLIVRYVYYYKFGFIIGEFPDRLGGFCRTDTIKIVCNTTKCQQCNRRWPSEVVTSYPC